jgi:hypothetical protein
LAAALARTAAWRWPPPAISWARLAALVELLSPPAKGAIPEARTGDAGRAVPAHDLAVLVLAGDLVDEQVLGDDHVAFQADHLGDVGDAARAVAQAGRLDDDVDRADDHLLDGLRGQAVAAHGDHALDTADGFARAVGVQRAHRAVVAGVHGLEEIERLGATDFTDDDAFGTHPQAVLDQVAHGDRARTFQVRRPGFQAHHVRLLQLQFGRVLAGHDALGGVDEGGHGVEQGGLARTRTAGDDDVAAAGADDAQDPRPFRADGGVLHQILHGQLVLLELPDGQGRTIQSQGGRDDVDARTVRETGVADRRAFVDAAADLADDPLADVHQLHVVAEADIGQLDLAAHFDEHPMGAIDHDVGDVVARQQRLQRTIAENVVADVLEQVFLLGDGHHHRLDRDDLVDDVADFLARRRRFELR